MKKFTFEVRYKKAIRSHTVQSIDAILDGRSDGTSRQVVEVKATKIWTALQRLGYSIWHATNHDDSFSTVKLVSVCEIARKECQYCHKKFQPYNDEQTACQSRQCRTLRMQEARA